MPWLQLIVNTTRQQTEVIEDAILAAGAASVTLQDNADQPILEPALGETPLWQQTKVMGLFDAGIDTDQTTITILANLGQSLPDFRWEILEDKDWVRCWMDDFKPMPFGKRLWVCPSWCEPVDPDAVNIMLDPGLAFGTGTHPTTALCLQWLDGLELTGKTVIDFGCGSGILGIAALLLGASHVIAIDNDPQALIATQDNAQRNHIADDKIHCYLPEQVPANSKVDIVVANILAGPLAELSSSIIPLVTSTGCIALSGILSYQATTVSVCYQQDFAMDQPTEIDGWVRLSGNRIT
jgi:ribosomal protein L11 methyltransferase